MLETSARLLKMLTLLQSRSFWSGADLAERLEVTERTVRRDIEKLRTLGYPVHASAGVAGGYQLGSGASLPPLVLDNDEALAVVLGLRTTAAGTVTGMEEAAVRALVKLEQVLPSRLRRHVEALQHAVVPLYFKGPPVRSEVLTAIASACRNEEQLRFAYADKGGNATRRVVEPHGLVHTAARWYLVAWDLDRQDFRSFRVDRITGDYELTGRRFVARKIPGGDAATYVARSMSTDVYRHHARVLLHASFEELAPRIPPIAGVLKPVGAQSCVLETGAHALGTIALHIALLGVDFEVQEPPELVEEIRAIAKRLTRAAAKVAGAVAMTKQRRRQQPRKKTPARA